MTGFINPLARQFYASQVALRDWEEHRERYATPIWSRLKAPRQASGNAHQRRKARRALARKLAPLLERLRKMVGDSVIVAPAGDDLELLEATP